MSSATSIDPVKADGVTRRARVAAAGSRDDTFRPWHFFVLASLLAATVVVVLTRQTRPEHLVLISITIGAAGFAGAALYRTLAPLVAPAATEGADPLSDSLRAILEREKQLALRAIKELEFDRAMGKISPKDFDEMAGRLRLRAMTLMKQLDRGAGGYLDAIESELSERLRKRQKHAPARAAAPQPACACGTVNDRDAAFCKHCGTRLAQEPA